MDTILMNSENSKTSDLHSFRITFNIKTGYYLELAVP